MDFLQASKQQTMLFCQLRWSSSRKSSS